MLTDEFCTRYVGPLLLSRDPSTEAAIEFSLVGPLKMCHEEQHSLTLHLAGGLHQALNNCECRCAPMERRNARIEFEDVGCMGEVLILDAVPSRSYSVRVYAIRMMQD